MGERGLDVLCILNICFEVADGGPRDVGESTGVGFPWPEFSFAGPFCSSTAQRITSAPLWQVV